MCVVDVCVMMWLCGVCFVVLFWEVYGEGVSDVSGAEARACAFAAMGVVENATIWVSVLVCVMGCVLMFFRDGVWGELDEVLWEWLRERCEDEGWVFWLETSMDGERERGARRIRARVVVIVVVCCGVCEDDGWCDGWFWCDDCVLGGCGKDYFVFLFESGECLYFRLVDDDGRRVFVDENEMCGFECEDGVWVLLFVLWVWVFEKKCLSEVKLNEWWRMCTAYVRRRVELKRVAREREWWIDMIYVDVCVCVYEMYFLYFIFLL